MEAKNTEIMNSLRLGIPTNIGGIQVVLVLAAGNQDNDVAPPPAPVLETASSTDCGSLRRFITLSNSMSLSFRIFSIAKTSHLPPIPILSSSPLEVLSNCTTSLACSSSSRMPVSPTFLVVLLLRHRLHVRPYPLRRCHLFLLMSLPPVPSSSPVMLPPSFSRSVQSTTSSTVRVASSRSSGLNASAWRRYARSLWLPLVKAMEALGERRKGP